MKKNRLKQGILLLSLVLILGIGTMSTLAWLADQSETVTNTMDASQITCAVTEDYKVQITEPTTIPAYVRATYVVTWRNAQGDVLAQTPSESDYTLEMQNTTEWFEVDGIYYYKSAVEPKNTTSALLTFSSAKTLKVDDITYQPTIEILAQAIQTLPTTAVEEVWPAVEVDTNGKLTPRVQP